VVGRHRRRAARMSTYSDFHTLTSVRTAFGILSTGIGQWHHLCMAIRQAQSTIHNPQSRDYQVIPGASARRILLTCCLMTGQVLNSAEALRTPGTGEWTRPSGRSRMAAFANPILTGLRRIARPGSAARHAGHGRFTPRRRSK